MESFGLVVNEKELVACFCCLLDLSSDVMSRASFLTFFTASQILRIYVVRWAGCRNFILQLFPSSHATFSGVRRTFSWGGFIQWHMVVICIWCALFFTSKFDVIFLFPNQSFGEVCWHNVYSSTPTPLNVCVIALNINYQRSKLGYRRKIHSTLRSSSS